MTKALVVIRHLHGHPPVVSFYQKLPEPTEVAESMMEAQATEMAREHVKRFTTKFREFAAKPGGCQWTACIVDNEKQMPETGCDSWELPLS
jgi:hypothetical protein